MLITWKYVKKLEDNTSVKNFLNEYNITLPEKIVNLLEEYNGGRPSEKGIITNTKREYVFKSLLSYNKNDKETIYNVYPDLFKEVPLYPIGTDSAGNFIC